MKAKWVFLFGLLILLAPMMAMGEEQPPYLNAALTPEQRTEDLLERMTLREKVGQLVQIDLLQMGRGQNEALMEKVIVDYGVGSILSGGAGSPIDSSPEGWANMANTIRDWSQKTRLRIPILYGVDAVHGHNAVIGAVIYPFNLALAASFNKELAREYASETADAIAATGIDWTFAPVLDVARDPRWGRTHETFGEDPYTVSEMGRSLILGFQGSGKIIACGKHYLGYSGTNNGHDRNPADFSERTLREIHLPPYQAAVEAGLQSIMIDSGEVNGKPVHASHYLMTDILRGELGFKGITISDYEDVRRLWTRHQVAASLPDALALSYNAGLDMNMEASDLEVVDMMESLVDDGRIPISRIDDAVRHILWVKFRLGLFERKPVDPKAAQTTINTPESRKLARTLATQSLVLLRNPGQILPLAKNVSSILVLGPSVDSLSRLCGGWTVEWQGAREKDLTGQTVLAAIRDKISPETKLTYLSDYSDPEKLKQAAEEATVVVAVVGEPPYAEYMGDSPDLALSADQQKMLHALAEIGTPTVVVAVAGRPLIIADDQLNLAALIWAFLPGNEGGPAIADVLFGDANPSGRLPITFPARLGQLPIPYTVKRTVNYDPLFPFGYGLSYTHFAYSEIQAPTNVKVGEPVRVSVKVKNVGPRAGDEVIMLYVRDEVASVTQPLRRLQGFSRVSLAPGEEKIVTFQLTPAQLCILDTKMRWVEEPGKFGISIGGIGTTVTVTE